MPFYKVPGLGVVHIKFSGGVKPPAPCKAVVGFHSTAGEQERCGICSEFLCDWPAGPGKTCDAPMCPTHAHLVGKNRHYCPDHFARHTHQNPQCSLFGFVNLAQDDNL